MGGLHSKKLLDEKNIFIEELFESLPTKESLLGGEFSSNARRLHETLFPIYIMKHFNKKEFNSLYLDITITNLIEAEAALVLGLKNAGMSALRGAIESALKFIYYEYHPIECQLHFEGNHNLTGTEYRGFVYSFPALKKISFIAKQSVENLWSHLCKYVHSDFAVLKTMTVVSQVSTVLELDDNELRRIIDTVKHSVKVIIAIFFAIDPYWVQDVEKAYYNGVLDVFTPAERKEVQEELKIA